MSVIAQKLFSFNLWSILLALVISAVCTFLYRRRRLYYLASKFPGLNGLPILGNALEFKDLTVVIPTCRRLMAKHGPCFKIWIGPALSVMIGKPEFLQVVLNHQDCLRKCSRVYNGSMEFIGSGLILAEPEKWKIHRKLINPAFNQKILDSYVLIFMEQSEILVDKLKAKVGKGTFNFYSFVDKCTLDIVCETSLCSKVGSQQKPTKFFQALSSILHLLIERVFRVWLHIEFIWERSSRGKLMKEVVGYTHYYTNMVLESTLENRKNAELAGTEFTGDELRRRALLDILLDAEEKKILPHIEVLHEISTLIFAGYDTAAIAMSYVMLCMAFYPDCLKKVQEELDEIYGDSDRSLELEDLGKMDYLERVIKEALRIYPPVSFTARRADKEIPIGEGYIIPQDSTIWISHVLTHHNPEHWPDPDRFDPDRFLPENSVDRHPYAYIPFSAGVRNCIGFKYGMMMMKTIMSSVLRRYVPKTEIDRTKMIYSIDVVLQLEGGFMITLEDRVK